jgi:hypothetical protein
VYLSDFHIFLCGNTGRPPPPRSHLLPPTATVKLASDWLGVGLELRAFWYWPTCQTGKKTGTQWIEEYLHSKYGRLKIGPRDIIEIVFNVHNVVLFFGGGANL